MNLVAVLIIYIVTTHWVVQCQTQRNVNSSVRLRTSPRRGGRGTGGDVGESNQWQQPRLDNRVSPRVINRETLVSGRNPRRRQKCRKIEIENGVTQLRNKGAFVKYFCSSGFQMLGENYAGCNDQGKWSFPPPVCVRFGCRQLLNPVNGGAYYAYGESVVDFFCNDGFRLEGPAVLFCNGHIWNGTEPSCERLPLIIILTPPPTTMPPRPTDLGTTTAVPEIDIGLDGSWGNFSGDLSESTSDHPIPTNPSLNVTTPSPPPPVTRLPEPVTKETTTAVRVNVTTSMAPSSSSHSPSHQPDPKLGPTTYNTTKKPWTMASIRVDTSNLTKVAINSTTQSMSTFATTTIRMMITPSTIMTRTTTIPTSTTLPTTTTTRTTPQTTTKMSSTTTIRPPSNRTVDPRRTVTDPFIMFSNTTRRVEMTNRSTTMRIVVNKSLCISKRFQSPECRQFSMEAFKHRTRRPRTTPSPEPPTTTTLKYNVPSTTTTTTTPVTTRKTTTLKIFIPTTTTMRTTASPTTRRVSRGTTTIKTESENNFDNTIGQVLKEGGKSNTNKVHHELISPFNIDQSKILQGNKYSQTIDSQHGSTIENNDGSNVLVTFASLFFTIVSVGMFSFIFYYCWTRNKGIARPRPYDSDGRNLSVVQHDTDDDFVYFGTSQL